LRFAPIIRVSTEAQEKKGESLYLQKRQIKETVKFVGGTIPKHCWQYCGQEHAAPDQGRKLFSKMLADCTDDLIDAVIYAEPTRWSRDQEVHARAIKVLQKNGKWLLLHPSF
jgi:DNA invertase Pin-like site-specific DNA recombinase